MKKSAREHINSMSASSTPTGPTLWTAARSAGELEFENFNAAVAKVTFKGRNVHPGYAKHKMLNSIRVANQFAIMLPAGRLPNTPKATKASTT